MLLMHPVTGEEHMIGKDLDFDLHNAIQELIAEGLLEENASAHRVARIVIHDGYDSLTPAQQALYDAVITLALRKRAEEIEGKRFGVAAF
jgi:ABC-type ATPase with predicted acetyltransferase domain